MRFHSVRFAVVSTAVACFGHACSNHSPPRGAGRAVLETDSVAFQVVIASLRESSTLSLVVDTALLYADPSNARLGVEGEQLAARLRVLSRLGVPILRDAAYRGCPGVSAILPREEFRPCPRERLSVVRVSAVYAHVEASIDPASADVVVQDTLTAMHIERVDLSPDGSLFQPADFILHHVRGKLEVLKTVPGPSGL
jgi:hypothetical protein